MSAKVVINNRWPIGFSLGKKRRASVSLMIATDYLSSITI
jgi:hypothetical protein